MAGEGELPEKAAAMKEALKILKLVGESSGDKREFIEDFRLDPNVNPGTISYSTSE